MAQRGGREGGGRPEVGGGRQNIPAHGPARVRNERPPEENRHFNAVADIPTHPTCITVETR